MDLDNLIAVQNVSMHSHWVNRESFSKYCWSTCQAHLPTPQSGAADSSRSFYASVTITLTLHLLCFSNYMLFFTPLSSLRGHGLWGGGGHHPLLAYWPPTTTHTHPKSLVHFCVCKEGGNFFRLPSVPRSEAITPPRPDLRSLSEDISVLWAAGVWENMEMTSTPVERLLKFLQRKLVLLFISGVSPVDPLAWPILRRCILCLASPMGQERRHPCLQTNNRSFSALLKLERWEKEVRCTRGRRKCR